MKHDAAEGNDRRAAIIEAATRVFLRYGFKKTSMEDLARAAGISRQGLYLHFPTKEVLFKAGLLRLIEGSAAAVKLALADKDAPVDERVLAAFVAIHGSSIGTLDSTHLGELFEAAREIVGTSITELEEGFVADIAKVLRGVPPGTGFKSADLTAKDAAQLLHDASYGIKHAVATQAAYRERMRVAVRLVCGP